MIVRYLHKINNSDVSKRGPSHLSACGLETIKLFRLNKESGDLTVFIKYSLFDMNLDSIKINYFSKCEFLNNMNIMCSISNQHYALICTTL
jgi:hypothetical protein